MHRGRTHTTKAQLARQLDGATLRLHEHEHRRADAAAQQLPEREQFASLVARVDNTLRHGVERAILRADDDTHRLVKHRARELLGRLDARRREEPAAARRMRARGQNHVDLLNKVAIVGHVEETIGLVQHDVLDGGEREALGDKLGETKRRCDKQIETRRSLEKIGRARLLAHKERLPRSALRKAQNDGKDLLRQLARRTEHNGARTGTQRLAQTRQNREHEGERLSAASGRVGEEILIGHHDWNRLHLNWRWCGELKRGQIAHKPRRPLKLLRHAVERIDGIRHILKIEIIIVIVVIGVVVGIVNVGEVVIDFDMMTCTK
jgi:hypothetical protein